jgi:hypothetical protein
MPIAPQAASEHGTGGAPNHLVAAPLRPREHRGVRVQFLAAETTQWIIAFGSIGSALIALALALGLRDWIIRPRVRVVFRDDSDPDDISDRVVTQRLDTGDVGAFVRVRLDNQGRSTARNAGLRLLKMHRWDADRARWTRARPELDGRLLQPSNQLPNEPNLVDIFPHSDRLVDLASVDPARVTSGKPALFIEISHPWPPNEANALESATWRLELLVCGDNMRAERCFITVAFDGAWPQPGNAAIWEHFRVNGPYRELSKPPE